VYITHDLATAYQISDRIIVLYRGAVAEAGDVELVVKQPRHPYTQLLLSSIPRARAERTWLTERTGASVGRQGGGESAGCRFAARCPSAMSRCREVPPPLFQTDRHRVAACYLHADAPAQPIEAP
jgi:oligopeptide/dipeptide ABC transporter ATP-binding protein